MKEKKVEADERSRKRRSRRNLCGINSHMENSLRRWTGAGVWGRWCAVHPETEGDEND
ncbi:hypothetical protein RUM43_006297, partial [Polyplax serrata]